MATVLEMAQPIEILSNRALIQAHRIYLMKKLTHLNAWRSSGGKTPLSISLPARCSRGESEDARLPLFHGHEMLIALGILSP